MRNIAEVYEFELRRAELWVWKEEAYHEGKGPEITPTPCKSRQESRAAQSDPAELSGGASA